ncbi:MAG: hypothetical protein NWP80_01460, partial [Candidatus Gracilibacteria bacterium]|nr:hypothetical protein [Candidatus Gracilibacteria bacterium]
MLEKLDDIHQKNYLTPDEIFDLRNKYSLKLKKSIIDLKKLLSKEGSDNLLHRAISLHALGIEKQYLKELFMYNEIPLNNFKYILSKINRQIERLETGNPQFKLLAEEAVNNDFFQKLTTYFDKSENSYVDKYIRNRTKVIITRKVIRELKKLQDIDFGFDNQIFSETIELYQNFNKIANDKKNEIYVNNKSIISLLEAKLTDKCLLKLEENIFTDLYNKEIITPK